MTVWVVVSGNFSCNSLLFGISSWVGLEGGLKNSVGDATSKSGPDGREGLDFVGDVTSKTGPDGGEGSMVVVVAVLGKEPNDIEVAVSNETGVR